MRQLVAQGHFNSRKAAIPPSLARKEDTMSYTWTITSSSPVPISTFFPTQAVITVGPVTNGSSSFNWTANQQPCNMSLNYDSNSMTYSGSPTFGGYNWVITATGTAAGSSWNGQLTATPVLDDSTTTTGSFVAQANTTGAPPIDG
jgi:hypothetical protein